MLKVMYYPGCTLKNKARDLDIYARKCAEVLGIEMEELERWQCCGGMFTSSSDEIVTKLSSVRALRDSAKAGEPLVTVCSACHNVIKRTNHAMITNPEFAGKVNRYLGEDESYDGTAKVCHYLEMLRDIVGFDKIKEKVQNPLKGRKIAAYYGCLLLRPGKVMAMDDAENPRIMEDLIRTLGAEPVIYPMRNECCGGYMAIEDKEAASARSLGVAKSAEGHGADIIVTACPLCRYNLMKSGESIPVYYFTELLAEALGVKEVSDDEE